VHVPAVEADNFYPVENFTDRLICLKKAAEDFDPVGPHVDFVKFRLAQIFPGGQHPHPATIFTPEFIFQPDIWRTREAKDPRPTSLSANNSASVQSGIYFMIPGHCSYFALLVEMIPHLLMLDRSIIRSSSLLCSRDTPWSILSDALAFLSVKSAGVFKVKFPTFVWDLYLLRPWTPWAATPGALYAFRALAFKRMNLTEIRPFTNVVLNREPDAYRTIENFGDLVDILSASFPHTKFVSRTTYGDLLEQVHFASRCRFLIAVTGCAMTNLIWMAQGTAVLEIQSRNCDTTYSRLGRLCGLRMFEITFALWANAYGPMQVNLPAMVKAVRAVMNRMEWSR
jgi:hypothetical protein